MEKLDFITFIKDVGSSLKLENNKESPQISFVHKDLIKTLTVEHTGILIP